MASQPLISILDWKVPSRVPAHQRGVPATHKAEEFFEGSRDGQGDHHMEQPPLLAPESNEMTKIPCA